MHFHKDGESSSIEKNVRSNLLSNLLNNFTGSTSLVLATVIHMDLWSDAKTIGNRGSSFNFVPVCNHDMNKSEQRKKLWDKF